MERTQRTQFTALYIYKNLFGTSIIIIILKIYLAFELWNFLRIFAVVVELKQMISKAQK